MLLRYLKCLWQLPGKASRHFLSMGLGIEQRAARLHPYWNPHLEASKSAQRKWLQSAAGNEVAVLGAGRLMDVDTAALAAKFATLWFVDADPLAAVYWRKCAVPLRWDVCDVSGVIKDWVRRVETTGGGWKQVLNQVRTLPRPAGVAFTPIADGIVSLNLLSQIPIVWQELLEQHLNNRFGVAFVKKQEQHWMDAMIPGARWLVEEHLKTLARTGARNILLIADLNYAYYRNAPSMPLEGATAPLAWDSGEWSASVAGVKFEVADSLFGVRLDDGEMFRQWMPGYEMDWRQIWLWHISPLGLEYKKRGTVHRVGAFALRKKATGGA